MSFRNKKIMSGPKWDLQKSDRFVISEQEVKDEELDIADIDAGNLLCTMLYFIGT